MIIKLLITKFLWSNYDYHFTIKELVEKFKNIWLVQEKYKNWKIHKLCSSNRIKKLQEFKKTETKLKKKKSYILQFIDSARFIASSLSNLVHNLSEGIKKIKCKYEHDDKKWETCSIK